VGAAAVLSWLVCGVRRLECALSFEPAAIFVLGKETFSARFGRDEGNLLRDADLDAFAVECDLGGGGAHAQHCPS
jgi:hypothetical protein